MSEHRSSSGDDFVVGAEPPDSAAARGCLAAYLDELRERFGFLPVEASPIEGVYLIARRGGEPIGCCVLRSTGPLVGEIKRFWIRGDARSLGYGRRLLVEAEAYALARGLRRLQLDTHGSLVAARRLYESLGYVEIAPYNDNEHADHWYEKQLVPAD